MSNGLFYEMKAIKAAVDASRHIIFIRLLDLLPAVILVNYPPIATKIVIVDQLPDALTALGIETASFERRYSEKPDRRECPH